MKYKNLFLTVAFIVFLISLNSSTQAQNGYKIVRKTKFSQKNVIIAIFMTLVISFNNPSYFFNFAFNSITYSFDLLNILKDMIF